MCIKSCVWMKLSQHKKLFAKISSVAQVMTKKNSQKAILAESTFFLTITQVTDNIFANCLFLWLSYIQTQLLIHINPIYEVIIVLPSKGPPFGNGRRKYAGAN